MTIIKWTATLFIILATLARSLEYHTVDLITGALGTGLWAYVGYKTKESALTVVNVFCLIVLVYGIVK